MDPSLIRYIWRHSRGEQVFLLLIILVSMPFYWVSLDVSKQIVNDAIQGTAFKHGDTARLFEFSFYMPEFLGGARWTVFNGIELKRIPYLFALSFWFLLLVLVNGGFKYVINTRKGILGERMLRRLRFDLFSQLLRFRPEDVAARNPAEVASMIKDELEPIGGFIGDAFIQPAFLVAQAATALLFIIAQSPAMGFAALVVVLAQAVIIPILRREQIRLGRERQLASRLLARRIGEVVEHASSIHTFGASRYIQSEIGDQLGGLYQIRVKLFRRKFAVKFLNNLLAQLTPFIFYVVGGYFAIIGTLNIGQLVAVIAAYRDLPPPVKDLIDWDQQRQDVNVKYEQVAAQFSPRRLLPAPSGDTNIRLPAATEPIRLTSVTVQGTRGISLLDRVTMTLDRPAHIALIGQPGSGRDTLARILGRQSLAYKGNVSIGETELSAFPDVLMSRFSSYVGANPGLMPGSIRDNILFALKRCPPDVSHTSGPPDAQEQRRRLEARLSGNPIATAHADWLDYKAMGISGPDEVDDALRRALNIVGAVPDIYQFGVNGHFDDSHSGEFLAAFVHARHMVVQRLEERGLSHLVDPFDPLRYNKSASIGENLLFGVALGKKLRRDNIANDDFVCSILEAEALMEPLMGIGLAIAEMAVETFTGLPPEHPVFQLYAAISPESLPLLREIVERVAATGSVRLLPAAARTRLLTTAMAYIEPRHRLGLIDEPFMRRMMRARQSFRQHLPLHYREHIEFYDPDRYIRAAPVGDNVLFGRISYGVANASERIYELANGVVEELGLDRHIFRLGLDADAGNGGHNLQPVQRARIAIARALVSNPDILILDNAFNALTAPTATTALHSIRQAMKGRTLIVTLDDRAMTEGFDRIIVFDGARITT